jgi:D-psicose/D-tagatose/L-ribulose 3-epimerase
MTTRMSRRGLLQSLPALAGLAALKPGASRAEGSKEPFRLAVCNETFGTVPLADACRLARACGYSGVEIAPATLSDDPASLPAPRRRELREAIDAAGIRYIGLHALLSAPKGLHITTPDIAARRRSWEYFRRLIDLCADLGPGGIMVLGSGKQRSTTAGATVADAEARLSDGLAELAPAAAARGVTILLEPLAPHLSDVVTSLGRAAAIAAQVGSPAVATMFDFHNAVAETVPLAALIKQYFAQLRHVHLNELDGRHPGTGRYDFRPVLQALKDLGYRGWISLEVFDFSAGGETIARDSARFARDIESRLD